MGTSRPLFPVKALSRGFAGLNRNLLPKSPRGHHVLYISHHS